MVAVITACSVSSADLGGKHCRLHEGLDLVQYVGVSWLGLIHPVPPECWVLAPQEKQFIQGDPARCSTVTQNQC